MSIVIAKIGTDGDTYQKLLHCEDEIFTMPDTLESACEYDPKTMLEPGEWFKITDFSQKAYCLSLLKSDFDSTEFCSFENDNFGKIEYIFSYKDNIYCFQRVTSAKQLRQKSIEFGDSFEVSESLNKFPRGLAKLIDRAYIYLKIFPDAIYCNERDALYFRSLKDISKIFIGIEGLYREATENEVRNFLNKNFIHLIDGFPQIM